MRWLLMIVAGIAVSQSSGCTTTGEFALFKNRDYKDPSGEADDPWVSKVGEEGRDGRRRESSGESEWFHNLLTSERARDIERSVGYDN